MLKNNIRKLFPKRRAESHKGDYGKVFILAGSDGMFGAALLCSRSAFRVGAGVVYLGIPSRAKDIVNVSTPEVIAIGGDSSKDFSDIIHKSNAIVVGPGLGARKIIARELLLSLSKQKYPNPSIVDADALSAFGNEISQFKNLGLKLILTPHPGEMGRLLGRTSEEIQKSRKKYAVETAKLLGCTIVLKGKNSIVANECGEIYINKTGNPGMATAGAGDVLAGVIGGLAGQGFSAWDAAVAGVYLHGYAGDLAAKEKGEYGMIASDIVEKLPYAIKQNR